MELGMGLKKLLQGAVGQAEAVATIGTGLGASIGGGLAAILRMGTSGGNVEESVGRLREVQQEFTYSPRSDSGKEAVGNVATLGESISFAGIAEKAGKPLEGAAFQTIGENVSPLDVIPGLKGITVGLGLAGILKKAKEVPTVDAPRHAGQGGVSDEAVRWVSSQKEKGIKTYVVNSKDGSMTELHGIDARDPKLYENQILVDGKGKDLKVRDFHSSVNKNALEGIINRAKSKLE